MSRNLSFWECDAIFKNVDIAIVGAGITGLFTSIRASEVFPKAKILVLERSPIPYGASSRNAGFTCFGSPTEILSDIATMGKDRAIHLVADRWHGIKELLHIIKPYDVDFKFLGGYELFFKGEKKKYEEVCSKISELNNDLKELASEVFYIDDDLEELSGIKNAIGAIYTPYEGQLHSGKLILKLLQKAHSLGVIVLHGVEVSSIDKEGENFIVHSSIGKFQSRATIVCTNGFCKSLLESIDVAPKRGQILVTAPLPQPLEWKGNLHWDEGYYYARNIGDRRILIGGARNTDFNEESTDEIEISAKIQTALEEALKKFFKMPASHPVEFRWAGIMGFGPNNEKGYLLGKTDNGTLYGVRLSGMGIALAPILSKKLVELINI